MPPIHGNSTSSDLKSFFHHFKHTFLKHIRIVVLPAFTNVSLYKKVLRSKYCGPRSLFPNSEYLVNKVQKIIFVFLAHPEHSDHFLSVVSSSVRPLTFSNDFFLRRGQVCFPVYLYGKNVQNFKRLLLWSLWADVAQISFEASLGQGNERLLKWLPSIDQDGRHAHNMVKTFKDLLQNRGCLVSESLHKLSGMGGLPR